MLYGAVFAGRMQSTASLVAVTFGLALLLLAAAVAGAGGAAVAALDGRS